MKKRLIISLFACALTLTAFAPKATNQNVDTTAKLKAVFIYNFTKYIDWPENYKSGAFTIGILGDYASLYNELTKMSKVKKASGQSLEIKSYPSISEVNDLHILYIPAEKTQELSQAVTKLKNNSTLIVTEEPGMAKKGAAINFVIKGNSQKFELNKANVERHNLKVASTLEKLALLVN